MLDTPSSGVDAKMKRGEKQELTLPLKQILLVSFQDCINDRLMTWRLPLSGNKHATIVSAYAFTMTNPDEVQDKFYNDLGDVISATPRTDKVILLGDFNTRVGTDHQTWEGVIHVGQEGVGKCNSNGLLLLRKCAEHDLLITNTIFRLPNRKKTSWMHPRSKSWHLLDYVILGRTDRQDDSDQEYVWCRLLDRS